MKLPFLHYTRYNDESLQKHHENFKPCLDQLKNKDINLEKFYENRVYKHKRVVRTQFL